MRLANDFKDKKCARCFQPLQHGSTIDAVYRTVNGITAVVLRKANASLQRRKSNRTWRRADPFLTYARLGRDLLLTGMKEKDRYT